MQFQNPEDISDEGRAQAIEDLRKTVIDSQQQVIRAQEQLARLLTAAPATSRAGHLRSLPELIGPPPQRQWQDEWVKLKAESYRLSGQGEETPEEDEAYVIKHDMVDMYQQQEGVRLDIAHLEQQQWPHDRAVVYTLLFTCADALGRALRERDSCYAASTYALSEALFKQRAGATDDDVKAGGGKRAASKQPRARPPQALYAHRDGLFSLSEREPAWENMEAPDGTGFRGLTSSALVHASCDPRYFTGRCRRRLLPPPPPAVAAAAAAAACRCCCCRCRRQRCRCCCCRCCCCRCRCCCCCWWWRRFLFWA